MNSYDLEGRVAIVTGAARGIGLAVAERLTASGASVAVWDVDGAEAGKAAASLKNAHPVAVDVSDAGSIADAVKATLDRYGRIDCLVNNAGIAGPTGPLWEYPIDTWRKIVDIDLTGVFLCCRAVVPVMLKNDYGRIVNVASVAGKEGNPNASAYSSAKAGVIALTKSLGKELASTGIRVNAVTPATVKTEILKQFDQSQVDYMLSKIPMGRLGLPEENAALIAWLCSDDCSFSTAAVFDTSGGRCTY